MQRVASKWFWLVAVLLVGLLLAGCGGGSGKQSQSEGQLGQQKEQTPRQEVAAEGITPDAIKVGIVPDVTGPTGDIGVQSQAGWDTYFKLVNEQGGINGRKLELKVEDGQYDQSREISLFKKLHTQDQVFTVVDVWTTGANQALLPDYIKEKNIVFPQSRATFMFEPEQNPYVFITSPPYHIGYYAQVDYVAKEKPGAKIGVMYPDNTFGQDGFKWIKKRAGEKGLTVVPEVFNLSDVDATSQLTNLKNAGVDYVLLVQAGLQGAVIFKAADQLQFKAPFILNYNTTEPPLIELAGNTEAIKNAVGVTFYATFAEDVPGIKQVEEMAQKYGVEKKLYYSQWYLMTWTDAMVFTEGLRKAGDNPTTDTLKEAIESLQDFNTGGLTAPLSYSASRHYGSKQVKYVKANVEKGYFEPVSDWYTPEEG
ncbi:MAG: hypothetical protein D9V47_04920 [Clostridia bacterium]|nr:MAG: hypothetical protein D9V47_04920 [Clostridia bacterium]